MELLKLPFRLLGVLSPVHIHFVTLVTRAKRVGADSSGNKYYQAPPRRGYKQPRRWVIYKGVADASKVPPEWHGWLHHQSDVVPDEKSGSFRQKWQKPHQPNLTGTDQAYHPVSHATQGCQCQSAKHYEAWTPE